MILAGFEWKDIGPSYNPRYERDFGPVRGIIEKSVTGYWKWSINGRFYHESSGQAPESDEAAARQLVYWLRDVKAHGPGLLV